MFDEKFEAIENNQYKVYNAGGLSYSPKENVSGEAVAITDISPIPHSIDVKASSKNLFKSTNYTKGTIKSADGSINTATNVTPFSLTTDYIYLKSGAYVVSNIDGANLRYVAFYSTDKEFKSATWIDKVKTFKFTITEDCYVRIDIERADNVAIDNFDTFCDEYKFMLETGTSATSYTPYVDISTVKVNSYGKNLFLTEALDLNNYTKTKAGTYEYLLPEMIPGNYYFSATPGEAPPEGSNVGYFYMYKRVKGSDEWKQIVQIIASYHNVYTPNIVIEPGYDYKFWVYSALDKIPLDYFTGIQMEVGESATPYEPYIEPTSYDAMSNGTIEGGIEAIYPNTTLLADTQGVLIEAEYYQDGKKVKQDLIDTIISLGGTLNV